MDPITSMPPATLCKEPSEFTRCTKIKFCNGDFIAKKREGRMEGQKEKGRKKQKCPKRLSTKKHKASHMVGLRMALRANHRQVLTATTTKPLQDMWPGKIKEKLRNKCIIVIYLKEDFTPQRSEWIFPGNWRGRQWQGGWSIFNCWFLNSLSLVRSLSSLLSFFSPNNSPTIMKS